ncbi:hypothetical protein Bbelb_100680, partial [Branchiostoma belcheri]
HGENLQYEYPQVDCEIAMESWYSEFKLYDPRHPVKSLGKAGHFTQVVWKGTGRVGCAWTQNYMACIYEPTGNTKSAFRMRQNVSP